MALVLEIEVLQLAENAVRRQLARSEFHGRLVSLALEVVVREVDRQSYAEMTRQPEGNEVQVEPLRRIVRQRRIGGKEILVVPHQPVEIERALRRRELL